MQLTERLVVHLVSQQSLEVAEVLDREAVVILPFAFPSELDALAKRVEDNGPRVWRWPDQLDQFRQGQPAPLGNARPALDTVVQGDLGLLLSARRSSSDSSTGFSTRPETFNR